MIGNPLDTLRLVVLNLLQKLILDESLKLFPFLQLSLVLLVTWLALYYLHLLGNEEVLSPAGIELQVFLS